MEQVEPVTRALRELYTVEVSHAEAGRLEAELRNRGVDMVDTAYGQAVTFTVSVEPGGEEELAATLSALTQGEAEPKEAGTAWVELSGR